jgi:hypothetical protein
MCEHDKKYTYFHANIPAQTLVRGQEISLEGAIGQCLLCEGKTQEEADKIRERLIPKAR